MSNQQRLLLGVLVAGNVVPVGYLFARSSFLASKSVPAHPAAAGRLPFVEMRDDRGAVVTTSSLIGSPLFVQFVNPYVDQQIASLRVLLASRSNNPVRFLLITSDAATLRNRLHVMMERALALLLRPAHPSAARLAVISREPLQPSFSARSTTAARQCGIGMAPVATILLSGRLCCMRQAIQWASTTSDFPLLLCKA